MPELAQVFTLNEFLVCSSIVLVAAVLQMSVGMGFGMLASPLVALVKPEIIPGSIMFMGLVVAFSGAWRERRSISPTELQLGIGGRIIGSGIAFLVLASITRLNLFMIFFGTMMLIAVLIAGSGIRIAFSKRNLFGLSIVSGVVGTITAVGAPPMALIYHNRPPEVVRPTLNAFFGAGAMLGLISLAASGWLRLEDLVAAMALLPAMGAGIVVSRFFVAMPAPWLSKTLLLLSGLASLILVLRGFGILN